MRRLDGIRSGFKPKSAKRARAGWTRDHLALVTALWTIVGLGAVFVLSKETQFLMPGPLVSAHGVIEKCSACHTKSGSNKLSWIHGIVAGNPRTDSKACLKCHKMPETAFNAHGASEEVLKQSTERLKKIATVSPVPNSARAQSMAFPTQDIMADGLNCATCHQEHQGVNFNLNKVSNEQCVSCHVAKFDSFDGHHPKFEDYPFKRRTRIIYDHAGHFGKHYPELKGKALAKHIPATCSTCHNSNDDRQIMTVAPFEQTCTNCHINQILGEEKASGPKGIAFLTLPGLDLEVLNKKNVKVGEWPDESEATLTPFMKVMISRNKVGRDLIKAVSSLNLLDLTNANDGQIKAVSDLAWEIKKLYHALISGKASDVLGDLNIVRGAKLSPKLVADLTASIPRDVLIGAQKQWLPNLAQEITNGPVTNKQVVGEQQQTPSPPADTDPGDSVPANEPSDTETPIADAETTSQDGDSEAVSELTSEDGDSEAVNESTSQEGESTAANEPQLDPQACVVSVFGQCLVLKGEGGGAASSSVNQAPSSLGALPEPMRAGLKQVKLAQKSEGVPAKPDASRDGSGGGDKEQQTANTTTTTSGKQSDDLLFPTEEEIRAMKALSRAAGNPAKLNSTVSKAAPTPGGQKPETPAPSSAPPRVISLESDVDPESWAEYGGWYRQDHSIFYKPVGHKDKFLYSWLFLTGPQGSNGDTNPAANVFDLLIHKDTSGACTKCHSVDDMPNKGRVVNFNPESVKTKQGRFTNFIHEPHFGVLENRGCLHCHSQEKGRKYLKSYELGNPKSFASDFGNVDKKLCQSCHTQQKARQDCLLCHSYHVNGVITPIINTKISDQ